MLGVGVLCGECHAECSLGTGDKFLVLFDLGCHDICTLLSVEECRFLVCVALVVEDLHDVLVLEGVFEGCEHRVYFCVESS